ncbi:hypothetical protein CEUSTIGMA_g680.t1 [Chlamydomonas eustigma]|uniref:Uncharacterized protein n=1 Tax=Chlamydomonas eustigma TaxID=1157962 RepID=A0A250WQW3_9CHLO|nr:hypothetical protein CEUSTIGMA_g680.t1 [Chlamydomonas eustigma]|eukprot:GAX73227.1 hypothetical protein CEUSTIGMA_g680.t1 [Chlamydomonas eustigma]
MAYHPPSVVGNDSEWKESNQDAESAPLLSESFPGHDRPQPLNQILNGRASEQNAASTAPAELHLPDPQDFWLLPRNRILLYSCFFVSTLLVVLALGQTFLFLVLISGFVGIAASASNLIPRATVDMAAQSKNSTVLCLVGLVLSTVSILQLLWILFLTNLECRLDPEDAPPKDCLIMYSYTGVSMLLVLANGVLMQMLMLRASQVSRMLNPVSSGMISLA